MPPRIPQPHPNDYNTARQVRRDADFIKNFVIKLHDVDFAIIEYMNEVIAPQVEQIPGQGNRIKVPIIYGSAERWASARKFGFVRDQKGQIQLPLIMIRRNSVAKTDSMISFNRFLERSYAQSYSPKNKYDNFSVMNGVKPTTEVYNVVHPDHVTLTYECMVWTNFTEHLNDIIEIFTFAEDNYWGQKNKFKFKASIDSFDISNELTDGGERVVRGSFNINVNAFLLPEEFANKVNTIKTFTPKRILMMTEIDTTVASPNANRYRENRKMPAFGKQSNPRVSMITEYQKLFDYITLSNSYDMSFVSTNSSQTIFNASNVFIVPVPDELASVVMENDQTQVFINGVFVSTDAYTVSNSGNDVLVTFDHSVLGYELDSGDDVVLRGKIERRR